MFNANEYNIEKKEKLLGLMLILALISFIFVNIYLPEGLWIRSYSPYFFIGLLIYFIIAHLKMKRIAEEKELKMLRLSMTKGDKRTCFRLKIEKHDNVRVTFSLVKYFWIFKYHTKKLARPIDISSGGIRLKTDTSDIKEGLKAERINITLMDAKPIVCDGLVVMVKDEICSFRFINLSKKDRDVIERYVLARKMEKSAQHKNVVPTNT